MQEVYQQPSCLAGPFCTGGSSTGVLTPCLQTDSSNRNSQYALVFSGRFRGGKGGASAPPLAASNIFLTVFSLQSCKG